MRIQIRGGRVIDPAGPVDRIDDLCIADGRIAGLGRLDGFHADRVIDATGQLVLPGLVDLCARLREPGHEHKATIDSETRAAAAAGITTLCVPPDTEPVIDTPAVVDMIHRRSRQKGRVAVHVLGAMTRSLAGERLAEMDALKAAGCLGISNALAPVPNTQVLSRALEYAATCGLRVFLHADDPYLCEGGVANEGATSTRLGLPAVSVSAELIGLSRALLLVEQTGVSAHFCRLSAGRSLAMIADAQARGLPVTADAGIAYLHLSEDDIVGYDPQYHFIPPLRSPADREALRHALADGTLAAVCSDHQPHDEDAKSGPFVATQPGASTLEHLLPLTLALVDSGGLKLSDAVAAITLRPARILGLNAGTLQPGRSADVCVVDPRAEFTVSTTNLLSAGKNTPFMERTLQGRVTCTLRRGQFTYDTTSNG